MRWLRLAIHLHLDGTSVDRVVISNEVQQGPKQVVSLSLKCVLTHAQFCSTPRLIECVVP